MIGTKEAFRHQGIIVGVTIDPDLKKKGFPEDRKASPSKLKNLNDKKSSNLSEDH